MPQLKYWIVAIVEQNRTECLLSRKEEISVSQQQHRELNNNNKKQIYKTLGKSKNE